MSVQVLDQLDQQAAKKYRELVYQLVSGQEPAADEVRQILEDAGITRSQLREDVSRLQTRKEAHDRIQDAKALRARQAEIERERAEVVRRHAELTRKYQQEAGPLAARIRELFEERRSLRYQATTEHAEAMNTLRSTGPDVGPQLRELQELINAQERLADDARRFLEQTPNEQELQQKISELTQFCAKYVNSPTSGEGSEINELLGRKQSEVGRLRSQLASIPSMRAQEQAALQKLRALRERKEQIERSKFDWRNTKLSIDTPLTG